MAYFGARPDLSRGEAVCYVSSQSSNIDTRPTIRPVGKRGMEKERKRKKVGRREKGKKEKRKNRKKREREETRRKQQLCWLVVGFPRQLVCLRFSYSTHPFPHTTPLLNLIQHASPHLTSTETKLAWTGHTLKKPTSSESVGQRVDSNPHSTLYGRIVRRDSNHLTLYRRAVLLVLVCFLPFCSLLFLFLPVASSLLPHPLSSLPH